MRAYSSQAVPRPPLDFDFAKLAGGLLDLEIGAGQGLHAIQYAQTFPDRTLLAVEKTHARYAALLQRHQSHPALKNLVPLHADAPAFVTHFLPDNSLERVFLLYPNPYPKAKQSNLRWHNRPFFQMLLSKMKPGAELTLATNIESYAHEAKQVIQQVWELELLEDAKVRGEGRTHFERKYLARGESCWNLRWRKPTCHQASQKVQ